MLIEYGYNDAGLRISKSVYDVSFMPHVLTYYTEYSYDGIQLVAEYEDIDLDGSVDYLARKFIYGPGIDEPICMLVYAPSAGGGMVYAGLETGRFFYHLDALGSVIALSQFNENFGTAQIVERYEYSPFGVITVTQNGNTGNPLRFTARYYDAQTGLYDYRARIYSPAIGRFLQPDPTGYADGTNMYAYCGNNPLAYTDPLGLCKEGRGFGSKLWDGDYVGTGYGQDSLNKWANWSVNADSWYEQALYDAGGGLAALWTPDTWKKTAGVLLGGWGTGKLATYLGKKAATKTAEKTVVKKGMNNPKVSNAAARGRDAHREFAAKVKNKPGWQSEQTIRGPDGKLLRPDAITPKGRPVELKPNTPSGRAQGRQQIQMYKEATGTNGRVIYYEP